MAMGMAAQANDILPSQKNIYMLGPLDIALVWNDCFPRDVRFLPSGARDCSLGRKILFPREEKTTTPLWLVFRVLPVLRRTLYV